jgi:hypothetical protein
LHYSHRKNRRGIKIHYEKKGKNALFSEGAFYDRAQVLPTQEAGDFLRGVARQGNRLEADGGIPIEVRK